MGIVLIVLLEIAFGVGLYALTTKFVGPSKNKAVETKKKSKAFIEGYKDMLVGGLSFDTDFEDDRDSNDHYSYLGYSHYYGRRRTTTIYFDSNNTPFFDDGLMLSLAEQVMDNKYSVNIEKGQYDDNYLGASDEVFAEYYAGGMKFLEDLDSAKQKVMDKKREEENRKRLIANRKAGLKEINRKIEFDMKALGELRAQAFKPELTMKEEWEEEWSK